ncbi:7326_t:CDS:2, partial [Rhizophagus irregularis]
MRKKVLSVTSLMEKHGNCHGQHKEIIETTILPLIAPVIISSLIVTVCVTVSAENLCHLSKAYLARGFRRYSLNVTPAEIFPTSGS